MKTNTDKLGAHFIASALATQIREAALGRAPGLAALFGLGN